MDKNMYEFRAIHPNKFNELKEGKRYLLRSLGYGFDEEGEKIVTLKKKEGHRFLFADEYELSIGDCKYNVSNSLWVSLESLKREYFIYEVCPKKKTNKNVTDRTKNSKDSHPKTEKSNANKCACSCGGSCGDKKEDDKPSSVNDSIILVKDITKGNKIYYRNREEILIPFFFDFEVIRDGIKVRKFVSIKVKDPCVSEVVHIPYTTTLNCIDLDKG